MNWLLILIQLIPLVVKLMEIAEKAFDDQPDSGVDKKDFVMKALQAVIRAAAGLSTGGQKETWEILATPIGMFIDAVCGFLFPNDD